MEIAHFRGIFFHIIIQMSESHKGYNTILAKYVVTRLLLSGSIVIWASGKWISFSKDGLDGQLLSPIKLIQARRTQLQPYCYLFHVVFKTASSAVSGGMRGYRCMLSDVRAASTDKATRLATITNHCQLAGQIFMSQWGPPRTRGPLKTQAIISPSLWSHTHFLSVGWTNIGLLLVLLFPRAAASAKSFVCERGKDDGGGGGATELKERTTRQASNTPSLKAAALDWRFRERDRRKEVKCDFMIKSSNLWEKVCWFDPLVWERENIQPLNHGRLCQTASILSSIHKQSTVHSAAPWWNAAEACRRYSFPT